MGHRRRSRSTLEAIPNPAAVVEGLDQGQQGKCGSLGLQRVQEINLSLGICINPWITSLKARAVTDALSESLSRPSTFLPHVTDRTSISY